MNGTQKRDYTAPEMEVLSLVVEPYMLDDGLTVGDNGDDYDIAPFATSGTWTPWV